MNTISLQQHRQNIEYKFLAKVTSKIAHFQENDGWVPGVGQDPNDAGNDITASPSADNSGPVWDKDLIDTLREARSYHRKAIRAVNSFIARAKANAGITVPSGVAQKFGRRR
jgi:hypothetical protein